MEYFGEPGFCPDCGSILPFLVEIGTVECFNCKKSCTPEVFKKHESFYTIHFNTYKKPKAGEEEEESYEGPVVERNCPHCNNDKMTYATLQLRSADEGQTVFYTCTSCKFKETENS